MAKKSQTDITLIEPASADEITAQLEQFASMSLEDLSSAVGFDHVACFDGARQFVVRGVSCGFKLRAFKSRFSHGEWEKAFEAHIGIPHNMTIKTAQRYLAMAQEYELFVRNQNGTAHNVSFFDKDMLDGFRLSRKTEAKRRVADRNTWLTPSGILKSAKEYLRSITCDPCAESTATSHIPDVSCVYDRSTDGLAPGSGWMGKAWIAPGHQGDFTAWIEKTFKEFSDGSLEEGLLFLPRAASESATPLRNCPVLHLDWPPVVTIPTQAMKPRQLRCSMSIFLVSKEPDLKRFANVFRDIGVAFAPVQ